MSEPQGIDRLRGLERHLKARLKGQDHLLPRVATAFLRGELKLTSPDRPKGSFLFVGPTGVGKTELSILLSEFVAGKNSLIRFDMSEFGRDDAVGLFLGKDVKESGAFGRTMEKRTGGVILFDEIEKAHSRLWPIFLQLLEPGHVTLADGRKFDLQNFYLIFCSNLGGAEAARMAQSSAVSIEHAVLRRVQEHMQAEWVGRIQEKCVFAPLSTDARREICELEAQAELHRLRGLGYDLQVSRETMEALLRDGFHPTLGARPLRDAVQRQFQEQALALALKGAAARTEP
ncbi:MAG: ATPase [Verrucomicrobia bacterium]|nr:ATPase [Verrucomicrobiota bacterium]